MLFSTLILKLLIAYILASDAEASWVPQGGCPMVLPPDNPAIRQGCRSKLKNYEVQGKGPHSRFLKLLRGMVTGRWKVTAISIVACISNLDYKHKHEDCLLSWLTLGPSYQPVSMSNINTLIYFSESFIEDNFQRKWIIKCHERKNLQWDPERGIVSLASKKKCCGGSGGSLRRENKIQRLAAGQTGDSPCLQKLNEQAWGRRGGWRLPCEDFLILKQQHFE